MGAAHFLIFLAWGISVFSLLGFPLQPRPHPQKSAVVRKLVMIVLVSLGFIGLDYWMITRANQRARPVAQEQETSLRREGLLNEAKGAKRLDNEINGDFLRR